jgi:hypothetical protein
VGFEVSLSCAHVTSDSNQVRLGAESYVDEAAAFTDGNAY